MAFSRFHQTFMYRNHWAFRVLDWLFSEREYDWEDIADLILYIDIYIDFVAFVRQFLDLFYFKILFSVFLKYRYFLKYSYFMLNLKPEEIVHYKSRFLPFRKYTAISKGYKHKNLGIYLKNLVNNNDDLYNENLKNLYSSYCYLLIRLNRKNLFLTLLNNEGNVLCKTNVGASGFKKKVKRTGYAIKGTGKNFIKKIRKSLIKNIFILYKKNIKDFDYNFQNKIENLKIIKIKNNINNIKLKRKKIKKKKNIKNIKKIKINILKKSSKKIIRSRLLWVKIFNNLKKYRIYYYPTLKNLIKKNLRIIFRIKTSLKLWAFRFVVYGLFKKLPWFRGIEFRLPIPHSNSLRLKKKRRV